MTDVTVGYEGMQSAASQLLEGLQGMSRFLNQAVGRRQPHLLPAGPIGGGQPAAIGIPHESGVQRGAKRSPGLVTLGGAFQRVKVTNCDDQAGFLPQMRTALQPAAPDEAVDRSF